MIDFLLDENFEIKVENGDLVIGDTTLQNQQLILLANKGENREFTTQGVGISNYILDDEAGDANGEIKRQFELDGMTVEVIKGGLDDLQISAKYE